jgi:hypothetical protein
MVLAEPLKTGDGEKGHALSLVFIATPMPDLGGNAW